MSGEIREAKMQDLPLIVELTRQMHSQTTVGQLCKFDVPSAKVTISERIQSPSTVMLYDGDGFLSGLITAVPFNHNVLLAQETGWFHTDKGGAKLIQAFERWAKWMGATYVAMGAMEGSTRPIEVLNRYYKMGGYTPFEHAYIKEI